MEAFIILIGCHLHDYRPEKEGEASAVARELSRDFGDQIISVRHHGQTVTRYWHGERIDG
jgi:hypothetical protein